MLEFRYSTGREVASPPGAREIDYTLDDLRLTFHLDEEVAHVNEELEAAGCAARVTRDVELSVLALGDCLDPADVDHLVHEDFGAPALGATLYSIYAIDRSGSRDAFVHGANPLDPRGGTSPADRESLLDTSLPHFRVEP